MNNEPIVDIDGNARPQDGRGDIGAAEHTP